MDELLRTTPGYYSCGLEVTLADLYLAPQLFHASVALEHFKGKCNRCSGVVVLV